MSVYSVLSFIKLGGGFYTTSQRLSTYTYSKLSPEAKGISLFLTALIKFTYEHSCPQVLNEFTSKPKL